MKRILKYLHWILPAALTVGAWVFFAFGYAGHLLYIEGNQMFLWNGDYMVDTVMRVGGMSDYIARFITQFYHWPLVGGALVALLLLALQQGVQRIMRRLGGDMLWTLSFVPPIIYWVLLCDENYTLSGLVALAGAVWLAVAVAAVGKSWLRGAVTALAIPAVWLLLGGTAAVTWLMVVIVEAVAAERRCWKVFVGAAAAVAIIAVVWVAVPWQRYFESMVTGGTYFYFAEIPVQDFLKMWGATVVVTVIPLLLGRWYRPWFEAVVAVAAIVASGSLLSKHYNALDEDVMRYYYLTHYGRWDDVIARAERKTPDTQAGLICVNLALAVTDQTGARTFDFEQHGPAGLFMPYDQDVLFSGEVLYRLGFINEAQHYAYESMASIPDHQRGIYFVGRLAETNMIAGRTEVARKYLNIMKQTLFYRGWAKQLLELMEQDGAVDAHPVYGSLRRMQPTENFAFVSTQLGGMLEIMLHQHPDNRPVYNYLMSYCMLLKDIDGFADHLIIPAQGLPRCYEEAFVMICRIKRLDYSTLPSNINRSTINRLEQYIRAFNMSGNNPEALKEDWGNTYWYYTNFVKF